MSDVADIVRQRDEAHAERDRARTERDRLRKAVRRLLDAGVGSEGEKFKARRFAAKVMREQGAAV